jgi:histidine triad (HIT) family protein
MAEPDFDKMSPEEIAEFQRQNCIFCKIIKGEIPSRKAYEDDKVICIMDINPAIKGHLLMMTKEHYPFLPIIPVDLSAHMFRITKALSRSVKQAMVTDKVTIFIANGGIAGQQSPHFLYHIIPRENGDGLDNFNIPSKEIPKEDLERLIPVLKGKLGLIMRDYKTKTGKIPVQERAAPVKLEPDKREGVNSPELAKMIMDNPKLKELIVNDPDGFKKELENNPELKKLFGNIDLKKLSIALGSIKE